RRRAPVAGRSAGQGAQGVRRQGTRLACAEPSPVPRSLAMTSSLLPVLPLLAALLAACGSHHASAAAPDPDAIVNSDAVAMLSHGGKTFRHDTFGSEAFYGDRLRLHQAIAGAAHGGAGPGLSPRNALALGLKVDETALPPATADALRRNAVNLDDPQVTLDLLSAD